MCFGCSKELIETVLLSTHNICFGWEIRKLNFNCALFIYRHAKVKISRLFECKSGIINFSDPPV